MALNSLVALPGQKNSEIIIQKKDIDKIPGDLELVGFVRFIN